MFFSLSTTPPPTNSMKNTLICLVEGENPFVFVESEQRSCASFSCYLHFCMDSLCSELAWHLRSLPSKSASFISFLLLGTSLKRLRHIRQVCNFIPLRQISWNINSIMQFSPQQALCSLSNIINVLIV